MQTGLCTIANTDWSVHDILATATETGFDGVEVWGKDHVGNTDADDGPNVETCHRIASDAREFGLDVPVYGSYLRAGMDEFRESLERELDAASALGTDLIRIWGGTQEYGGHEPDHWQAVVDDLGLAGDRASERGIGVTVEKHEGSLTNEREGARRLIEAVDSSAIGLNWQPLFFLDNDELLTEAEALAPLTNNIHLQATRTRNGSRRCPLSEAYFDIPSVLDAFDDAGFDGYAELEFVDPETDYRRAVRDNYEFLSRALP